MDNTGGHGTQEVIDGYTRTLYETYNVEIIHQAPRLPETNALDLGIWCRLQAAVEKIQNNRWQDPDTLALSVNEAWEHLPVDTMLKVFN